MNILFPRDPVHPKSVEHSFGYEAQAAKEAGFGIGRIDLEIILGGEVTIANVPEGEQVLYRGWLVRPEQYRAIADHLNGRLLPAPEHYERSYVLPAWYERLARGVTPRSIWLQPGDDLTDLDHVAALVAATFEDRSVVVKDYVKSAKHRWFDACFIRDARDMDETKRVVRNFLDTVQDGLVGSLVFREFIDFRRIGTHPKIGLPLINEWRAILSFGKVIYLAPYWANGDYSNVARPEALEIERLSVGLHDNPFIAVDVAETDNGQQMIIEVNPGGAAGVPEGGDVRDYYRALRSAFTAGEEAS